MDLTVGEHDAALLVLRWIFFNRTFGAYQNSKW